MGDALISLLLVAFLASSSLFGESQLKITPAEIVIQANDPPIHLEIIGDNNFIINEVTLTNPRKDQLAKHLREGAKDRTDPLIMIRADSDINYQDVIMAMNTAQQLGYKRLYLTSREENKAK